MLICYFHLQAFVTELATITNVTVLRKVKCRQLIVYISPIYSLLNRKNHCPFILIALIVLAVVQAQGDVKPFYEKALKDGSVNVYRGRVLLVGQDRAGKTSLKKSLLGLPFNPKEQSTEGIKVDPSACEIEVDQVKNWNSTSENKPSLAEFSEDISRMLAEKLYRWIVNEEKKDSGMKSDLELTGEESTMEVGKNSSGKNQPVCTFKSSINCFAKKSGINILAHPGLI